MSEETQPAGTFVLPTQISVERYMTMKVEAILNTEYQITGEKTPFEHCLTVSKNAQETVELLGLPEAQAEIALDLLEDALEGAELEEIYGTRGGVLNILMPEIDEDDDLIYQAIENEADDALPVPDFVHLPNELFSSLTPAQVWVGTGKVEMALAEQFLPILWQQMQEEEFPSPGAANTEWLSRLRLWSYNPAPNFRGRVIDIVTYERNENLRKRVEMHQSLGHEVVFRPND